MYGGSYEILRLAIKQTDRELIQSDDFTKFYKATYKGKNVVIKSFKADIKKNDRFQEVWYLLLLISRAP